MPKSDSLSVISSKGGIEIITRETLYHGFLPSDLYRLRHCLFSGQMNHEVRKEIFERDHATALLPLDPVRDEVILIEQIRATAYDTNETSWLPEMVAGTVEEGKSVGDVTRREVIGETGLVAKRIEPMLSFLASPRGTSKRSSIMVGKVDATAANGTHGLVDGNEGVRVHVVSQEQTYQWVEEGKTGNTASVIAL